MRLLWGLLLLCPTLALAECTKDTDCKGDRICTEGKCVDSDVPHAEPQPAAVSAPVSAVAQADRIARITQLRGEVIDMKADLHDADLPSPIIKLVLGTGLAAVAIWSFSAYGQAVDCQFYANATCANPTTYLVGTILAGAGALALLIYGGVQLRLHLTARQRLPGEIRSKEEQLRILEGSP